MQFFQLRQSQWESRSTIVKPGKSLMKMVIDGGRTMNVVAQSAVKHCHIKVKSHPHPLKVTWANKSNVRVTQWVQGSRAD